MIEKDSRVKHKQTGDFGMVETVVEHWESNILVSRLLFIMWEDGNMSEEHEDDLELAVKVR
jgi:hypothetical protein